MDHRVKLLWFEALRSGQWPAGGRQDFLYDVTANTWSPLGVLCEIANQNGNVLTHVEDQSVGDDMIFRVYDGASIALPESVKKWAVLRAINPRTTRGRMADLYASGTIDFFSAAELVWHDL